MEECLLPQPSPGCRAEPLPPEYKFLSWSQSPIQNTKGLLYNFPRVIIVLLPRKVVGRKNKAQCVEAMREGLQNIVLEHSWKKVVKLAFPIKGIPCCFLQLNLLQKIAIHGLII